MGNKESQEGKYFGPLSEENYIVNKGVGTEKIQLLQHINFMQNENFRELLLPIYELRCPWFHYINLKTL